MGSSSFNRTSNGIDNLSSFKQSIQKRTLDMTKVETASYTLFAVRECINETLFGLSIPSRLTKSIRRKRWVRVEWGWGVKPTSAGSRFPSRTHTNPIHGWKTPKVIRAKRQSNGKAFKPLDL